MLARQLLPVRLLTAIIVLSITFSSAGIKPTQAQNSPTIQVQQNQKLEATLDESVILTAFPATGTFIVHFNSPMDSKSSPNPLLTYPYIDGTSSWDAEKNTLTFTPKPHLHPNATYTFFIDPALGSSDGRVFESSPQWSVQVAGGTKILSVSPKPGLLSTRKPIVEVMFDRPMNRTSTEMSFSVQPNIPMELNWKDDRSMQVRFEEPLQFGAQYTFMFAGSSSITPAVDQRGTPLTDDYSWSYGLETFSATVPPLTSPRTVQLKFSHDLSTTKTGLSFIITPALNGEWKWQGNKTVLFIAKEAIPLGQIYSIEITEPLIDRDGEVTLDATSFKFIAPPPISSVEPAEKGNPVPTGFSPIKIKFSTEVEKRSAEASFSIIPQVSGRFEWSKSKDSLFDNLLSFYPNKLLQANTQYNVKLDTGLADLTNNSLLLEPYTWNFHTAYGYYGYIEEANFGYGAKIQIVDVLGPRRIQFGTDEKQTITFEAYAYDLIDFAALYADYVQGNEIPIPNETKKEPVATWNYNKVNPKYQETIIPPDVPSGLYILNLKYGGRSFDKLFVVLTRNTIVAKQAGDELFVWVSNINGDNVPEAEIRLYSDRGEKIREGKTDENGLYRVSIPEGYNPLLVSARTGENNKDIAITGLNGSWREYSYNFWSRQSDSQKYLTYIYTDRPIYKPGQTVNFKAVVRRDKDLKYAVPDIGLAVTINVRDAKNNILQTSILSINEFGTVNGLFDIADEARLGEYKVETVVSGESNSQAFKVQDYRKPDFKVTVSPSQEGQSNKYVHQDKVNLTINTEYFFGEPVANANLTYKIYRLVPKYYGRWDTSSSEVSYSWLGNAYNPGISITTTDTNGLAQVAFTARFADDYYYDDYDYWNSNLRSRTYAIEVTAEDGSNQTVSSSYIFNVYNAMQKISLDTQGYFKQANQPFSISIHTKTIDDQPLPERDLNLKIKSWNSKNYNFNDIIDSYKIKTDKDGLATQELKLSPGYYKLALSGKDERGNQIEYERWLKVLASTKEWTARYWDPISISAEKDEYKPYQNARFVIESTVSGPALLTFERGSVIHSKFITLTAPLTVVEAEVIPEDAPNVFVTVNAWAPVTPPTDEQNSYYRTNIPDSQLMMATTELMVSAEASKLQVDISTDKQTYSPGESITVNIDVKDSNGSPELAEVSLAMVDEAIFSLSNELAPDIFSAFYEPRSLSVATYTSMNPFRVILDGGGRGGGGGEVGPAADPRADFRDTAAWFPALRTNANGRATATFTLPDNLTSWRLSAKAITLNHLVGQSHINIETKKELLLRPLLPRVLTTGDQAQITTMIHNYTNTDQNVRVTLNAPGLKIKTPTQSIQVRANTVMTVGWSVVPEIATEINVTIIAVTESDLNDAITLPLPIQPLATRDIQSISGKFNGAITLPLPLPPDITTTASTVTLKVSRTPASTILDGLEYLTGYPYGCVEQTMSRAMPNAVLGRASTQLGIGGEEFKARTKPLIDASIQKLLGLQHSDGGWGWWYDDYSDAYQTAWVLHGLSNIQEAGYFIDPQVLEKGSQYLNYHLADMDIRTRAYALYSMALAGYGNLGQTRTLEDTSLTELDPFSQAALALALYRLGDTSRASIVLTQLDNSVVKKDDLAYWVQSTDDGEYHRKTMSSTIRTTALALSAFMEIQGASPLTDSVANYLIEHRTGYGWGTTNETSFTILALTDYLTAKQESNGSNEFTIELNNKKIMDGVLQTGNLFTSIDIPLDQIHSGLNNLKITTSSADPLYYNIVSSYITQKVALEASGNVIVTRRYLDPKTNTPLASISEGQLVKVELTINIPDNASFIIVEDHLPGGLEALNESLNSTTHDIQYYESDYFQESFFWQDLGYNYKEISGDHVSFFITEIKKGTKTLKYYARAIMRGTFTALPAEAYAMYDDQIWGRSSSASINISPR